MGNSKRIPYFTLVSSDDSAGFVDCIDCQAPITLHSQGLLFTRKPEAASRLRPPGSTRKD